MFNINIYTLIYIYIYYTYILLHYCIYIFPNHVEQIIYTHSI